MRRRFFVAGNRRILLDVSKSLRFWAGYVAQKFGLVLPEDCPPGVSSGLEPGDGISSLMKTLSGTKLTRVPAPPEGKVYWWTWYW